VLEGAKSTDVNYIEMQADDHHPTGRQAGASKGQGPGANDKNPK